MATSAQLKSPAVPKLLFGERSCLSDIVVLVFPAMLGPDYFGGLGNIELSVDQPFYRPIRSGGRVQHVSHTGRLGTLLVEPVFLSHE